jgi:hypothetical protein
MDPLPFSIFLSFRPDNNPFTLYKSTLFFVLISLLSVYYKNRHKNGLLYRGIYKVNSAMESNDRSKDNLEAELLKIQNNGARETVETLNKICILSLPILLSLQENMW